MSAHFRWVTPLLLTSLTACSTLAPFEAAQPADDEYAVCYTDLGATPKEIEKVIAPECPANTAPHFLRQGFNLSSCPLLTPIRVDFNCAAPAK